MLRRRALILAVLAATAAGCGSADAPTQDAPRLQAKPGAGGVTLTTTDGRVGDATQADPRGVTQLGVQPVPARERARRDGIGAGAACADAELMPDGGNLGAVVAATLCLLNGERTDAGLPSLSLNDQLAQAAAAHSQDMVAAQYFAHEAPDGSDVVARTRAAGYIPEDRRWIVGENLAWGTGPLATPRQIVIAWMNSQGHRDNILRPDFREIGFGVVPGNPRGVEGGGATYTTVFGAVSGNEVTQVATTDGRRTAARRAAARRRAARARAQRRARRSRRAQVSRRKVVVARIALGARRPRR